MRSRIFFFLEPRLMFSVIPLLLTLCSGNASPYELLEEKKQKRHHTYLIKILKSSLVSQKRLKGSLSQKEKPNTSLTMA